MRRSEIILSRQQLKRLVLREQVLRPLLVRNPNFPLNLSPEVFHQLGGSLVTVKY